MTMADVTGADFRGVDLRYVRGLTLRQLRTAHTDAGTRLPVRLRLVRAVEHLLCQLLSRRQNRKP